MGSLILTWAELRSEIGFYLGHGRTSANWSDEEAATVNAVVNSGCRNFYFPKPLPGMIKAHEWSFLRPIGTFAAVEDAYKYDLPSDFGGFDGGMIIDDSSSSRKPLRKTGITEIMRCQSENPTLTGVPAIFADGPKMTAGLMEQVFECWLYPTPNDAFTMKFRYRVNPKKLELSRPYPYGGAEHSETLLASCLAVAEKRVNDGVTFTHQNDFMERLAASISQDQARQPDFYGYNGDRSGGRAGSFVKPQVQALHDGVLPEDYTGS